MTFIQKLHYLIEGQLPDYVVDQYPLFVEFLRAYYRYLDEVGQVNNRIASAITWMDIDETLDIFLPHFRRQYAQEFPESTLVYVRRLLKHIGDFYEAKGSINATKLFFRLVFNESAEVVYPNEYILRTSDGIWRRRIIVKLDSRNFQNNPFNLQGKRIQFVFFEFIPGQGNVRRQIETRCIGATKQIEPDVYQLEIDLSPLYQFPDNPILPTTIGQLVESLDTTPIVSLGEDDSHVFVIHDGVVYGRLTRQLVRMSRIVFPGSNFRIDDSYIIGEGGVEGPFFALDTYFTNTDTDTDTVSRPYFVQTFDNNAVIRVSNTTPRRQPAGVYFLDTEPFFFEDYFTTVGQLGAGIRSLQIVKTGQRFVQKEFTIDLVPKPPRNQNIPSGARLVFETGLIYHEPGQFKNAAGFLSDVNKLQDNYYYQPFSYVVQTRKPFINWRDTFTKTAHPAGLKLFAQWLYTADLHTSSTIDQSWSRYYTSVVYDTIDISETLQKNVVKFISNDYFEADYFAEEYFRDYDGIALTDSITVGGADILYYECGYADIGYIDGDFVCA